MRLEPLRQLNGRAQDTFSAPLVVAVNENGPVCHRMPRDTDSAKVHLRHYKTF
jgi:hypothetical protein